MKKLLLLIVVNASWLAAYGQPDGTGNVRSPAAREKIRAAHAAYITERLDLSTAEAEKFWPVYREYLNKRRQVRESMREARKTDKSQKELLELDLGIKQEELDLEKEYMKKLEKIISAEKLLNLREAELDFRKLLLRQLQERRRQRR